MAETLTDLKQIKPGDFACLTDDQTIEDMMEAKIPGATDGLQLEVEKVYHIKEQNGLCDWYICPLQGSCPDGYPKLWLFIKAVDDVFDLRVYWTPDDFATPRTRGDLVNDGVLWLFQEPENKYDFKPSDLKFTGWIDHETDSGVTKFDVKGGELHGECREKPIPSGLKQPQPATVVEYNTGQDGVEDTEVLIIELGGLDEHGDPVVEGGVVYFFLGSPVANNDIELIQQ